MPQPARERRLRLHACANPPCASAHWRTGWTYSTKRSARSDRTGADGIPPERKNIGRDRRNNGHARGRCGNRRSGIVHDQQFDPCHRTRGSALQCTVRVFLANTGSEPFDTCLGADRSLCASAKRRMSEASTANCRASLRRSGRYQKSARATSRLQIFLSSSQRAGNWCLLANSSMVRPKLIFEKNQGGKNEHANRQVSQHRDRRCHGFDGTAYERRTLFTGCVSLPLCLPARKW